MEKAFKGKIAIVVLEYGNAHQTLKCVESLLGQASKEYVIIIVDNNSPEGDKFPLESDVGVFSLLNTENEKSTYFDHDRGIFLIRNRHNYGYGAGNNVGVSYAIKSLSCNYVWILNNDTVVDPEACESLIEYLINNTDKKIIGHSVIDYNSGKVQTLHGMKYRPALGIGYGLYENISVDDIILIDENEVVRRADYVYGASFVIRHDIVEGDLFDQSLFLYYEELDLYARANLSSRDIGWSRKVIVHHKGGSTISPHGKSELSEFHSTRSFLIYTYKHRRKLFALYFIIRTMAKLIKYFTSGDKKLISVHIKGIGSFKEWKKEANM